MKLKKEYIIASSILLIILGAIFVFFMTRKTPSKDSFTTLTATDGSFSIQLPSNLTYRVNEKPDANYTLDIYVAKDEMYCYTSTIEKKRTVDLFDIVTQDKASYLADKQHIRDDTGITKISIQNYSAYEYSLTYYDSAYGKDFYTNVIWIETDKNLYLVNLEVVAEHATQYHDIFLKLKNSFVEL